MQRIEETTIAMTGLASTAVRIGLVDGFELRIHGTGVLLPLHAQRLLAFLALHRGLLLRPYVAGKLWADTSEARANANLRSTVWRIERLGHCLLDATRTHLRLSPGAAVDVAEAAEAVRQMSVVAGDDPSPRLELPGALYAGELLPDWYDEADWLILERTRFHQLRIHALERISQLFVRSGRIDEAVDAALAAVAADPLRESAHRAVISAHLAEGNIVEAIRQYDGFRTLVAREMGTKPTRQMEDLMAGAW